MWSHVVRWVQSNGRTRKRMSGQAYMSIHGNLCYSGLLRGSVVPAKCSCLTRCIRKRRRSTRWLCYGLVNRARCVPRDVTLHRLSVLIRLVDNSPLDSRLHLNASHAKECLTHHPCIESVTVDCLCQCCTHKSSITLSSYFAHGSGASGYSFWLFTRDPRQYVMATVEALLTRLVNLENEAVQARQRQASAEQALAVAQQRIAQLSSGTDVSTTPPAHSWEAEVVLGSDVRMDNLAIHVQGNRVCSASEDERSFRLGNAERRWSGQCKWHHGRVAVTEHTVVLYAGDYAERSSSGDCSELSWRYWCRSVAQVALGTRTWSGYQIRSNVAISAEEKVWWTRWDGPGARNRVIRAWHLKVWAAIQWSHQWCYQARNCLWWHGSPRSETAHRPEHQSIINIQDTTRRDHQLQQSAKNVDRPECNASRCSAYERQSGTTRRQQWLTIRKGQGWQK